MARTQQPPPVNDGLTIIGEGIHVNGQIRGEEDLRVEGRVDGSIHLTQTVIVAASGIVSATIEARDVVISGVVVGNVKATNSVNLDPGAKLVGDIDAPRVIIADGAAFRGNVTMGDLSPGQARARPAAATRTTPTPTATTRRAATPSRATPTPTPTTTRSRSSRASTARRSEERAATPRVAAIRPPREAEVPDEEVTVIVRHAEVADDEGSTKAAKKKTAKKAPPRGRVPKRGKRRVNRRS